MPKQGFFNTKKKKKSPQGGESGYSEFNSLFSSNSNNEKALKLAERAINYHKVEYSLEVIEAERRLGE